MTCELTLRDVRSVARIVNLAHRFNCRTTHVTANAGTTVSARFAFDGAILLFTEVTPRDTALIRHDKDLVTAFS